MVTLSEAPGNRLCHSPSSVGVKGGATSRYDVGDVFITGGAPQLSRVPEQKSHFQRGAQLPASLTPAMQLCVAISKFRRASNYYCRDVICV